MYILEQERPQNCGYDYNRIEDYHGVYATVDQLPMCINCKHSAPNDSYPKDEMDCQKTGGICNALFTCEKFDWDC